MAAFRLWESDWKANEHIAKTADYEVNIRSLAQNKNLRSAAGD